MILQTFLFLEKNVRFLHKLTAAVYIKVYKCHDNLMKSDVTNMQYYKIDLSFLLKVIFNANP
jgi:hypothetical protein